jgi:D-3-phosphoglycerate dehydrogenase
MKKVLIPTQLDRVARETLERSGRYQVVQPGGGDLLALAQAHPDTYALIVRSEKVTPAVIDTLPALKVIIRAGAGYNNIDTPYARKKKIDVMNTPGANANAVAEEALALILADARHLIPADASCRAGEWEKTRFMGRELSGKTVGIVGLGAIGQTLVRRLSGFGVKLLGYDPMISRERALDMEVELVELPALFEQADYVSLHLPENEQTRGLVNAALLNRMKPGATLVNCARAGVVNENDLRAARKQKALRFLNDVYPKDEPGPKSVADIADIMVPHLGASTFEANWNAARRAAEQLIEFDEKGISSFIVNRDIPAGLDEAYGELAYTLSRLCRHVLGRHAPIRQIETSFYGTLKPYGDWLLVPIVAALSEEFDRSNDFPAARKYLLDRGIHYVNRTTDDRKGYENSITIDFIGRVDAERAATASVRGTVAEGNLMISRINDFNKLYFDPKGRNVVFTYQDRPGILGRIGARMAEHNINIDDVRNPHDSKGHQPVPDAVIEAVARDIEAHTAFYAEI